MQKAKQIPPFDTNKEAEKPIVTTKNAACDSRENWLNKCATVLIDELLNDATGLPAPSYRLSLTAPKTTKKTAQIAGECWAKRASADGHNEIFITAQYGATDSVEILAVLIHELIHAYSDNKDKHGPRFVQHCIAAGLAGGQTAKAQNSFTATTPTPELAEYLQELIETDGFGPIPHEPLKPELSGKKTQTNRNLLVKCSSCGFGLRGAQSMIDRIVHWDCLACDTGTMSQSNP